MRLVSPADISASHLEQIFFLRATVWTRISRGKVTFPNGAWSDDLDHTAAHWAIVDRDRVVACARASLHDVIDDVPDAVLYKNVDLQAEPPIASINRMVVHHDFSGLGLSKRLDDARIMWAREMKCRCIVATCSEYSTKKRLNSLTKLGFHPIKGINIQKHWDDLVTVLCMYVDKAV